MEVIERNTSRQLPEYIEMGFEAQVSMENLDFVLFNPNTTEYIVNIILHDNKVTMELVGAPLLYRYEIALEDKTTYPPKSIIQFDPTLPLGTSKILEVGKKGSLIKVLRNKMEENGEIVSTELISEDFYPPVHQVVLSSILSRENTEAEATEPEDDIEGDE
jgi:vancomycin resistance protein YoaR